MSYRSKSTDSFRTRRQFFVFDCVIHGRETFTDEEFMQFEISERLIRLYTAEYFQIERKGKLKSVDCALTVDEIYYKMLGVTKNNESQFNTLEKRYFIDVFEKDFPEDVYKSLLNVQKCHYCGITSEDIKLLADKGLLYKKNERGWTFEIDRKKSNLEYTTDNCVAACYWCNNAKTDEFDDVEFKPIGLKIGEALRARLAP